MPKVKKTKRKHREPEEGDGKIKCKKCKISLKSEKALQRHTQEKHENLVKCFSCPVCTLDSLRKAAIKDHLEKIHPLNKGLPIAPSKWKTREEFEAHRLRGTPRKQIKSKSKVRDSSDDDAESVASQGSVASRTRSQRENLGLTLSESSSSSSESSTETDEEETESDSDEEQTKSRQNTPARKKLLLKLEERS